MNETEYDMHDYDELCKSKASQSVFIETGDPLREKVQHGHVTRKNHSMCSNSPPEEWAVNKQEIGSNCQTRWNQEQNEYYIFHYSSRPKVVRKKTAVAKCRGSCKYALNLNIV